MKTMEQIKEQVEAGASNEELLREFYELKKYVAELTERLEAQKAVIKKRIADGQASKLSAGEFTATLTERHGESFDLKRAKEVLKPELLSPFLKATCVTALTVRRD